MSPYLVFEVASGGPRGLVANEVPVIVYITLEGVCFFGEGIQGTCPLNETLVIHWLV